MSFGRGFEYCRAHDPPPFVSQSHQDRRVDLFDSTEIAGDNLDFLVTKVATLHHVAESIGHEFTEYVCPLSHRIIDVVETARFFQKRSERSLREHTGQVLEIHEQAYHAVAGTAQTVRVAGAGRLFGGFDHQSSNRVELVGQRDGRPRDGRFSKLRFRRRRVGFHADREVVEIDCLPHFFGQPFHARVDPTHRALKLGELADHVGREIRLREPGRDGGMLHRRLVRGERFPGDPFGQPLDPFRFLLVRSELLVKQQRRETSDLGFERRLAIRFPEEARVAQARADDPLGVAGDGPFVVRLGVDHREERILQLPVVALHRKVMLMVDERCRQHFVRQLEELGRECSCDDRRIFHEVRHFLEQARVGSNGARHAPLQALRLRVQLARDLVVSLRAFEDDEILQQPRAVFVERSHFDRASRPAARREEAVAVRDGTRRHVLHLPGLRRGCARDVEGHDAPAVQKQDPANRPPEQQLALAVLERCVPAHRLRKREPAERPRQDVRQHVDRRPATLTFAERQVLPFGRLNALERRDVDGVLGREADGGRRRGAVRLERRGDRRSVHQLLQIGLALGNADDANRQPPRGAERFGRRLGLKTMLAQLRHDDLTDVIGQRRQPARGDLFAADLEQQFAIHPLRPFRFPIRLRRAAPRHRRRRPWRCRLPACGRGG